MSSSRYFTELLGEPRDEKKTTFRISIGIYQPYEFPFWLHWTYTDNRDCHLLLVAIAYIRARHYPSSHSTRNIQNSQQKSLLQVSLPPPPRVIHYADTIQQWTT